ncbi:MAG: GDSL-type esterase/lipase family protein [Colwellia sp.]
MYFNINIFKLIKRCGAALLLVVVISCSTTQDTDESTQHWTTSWATATEDIREGFWMSKGHFPPKPLKNDTLRMFMRTSLGGDTLRVKFSNAFGKSPLTIQNVHIAMADQPNSSASNGKIKAETDTVLKFKGNNGITIPAGETIYSDAVDFKLPALSVVAISIHYGDIDEKPITGHRGARTTSFFAKGNVVSKLTMDSAVKKDVWYTATGIEVMASPSSKTIVTMGDSITDGYGTKYNYHTRWTDYLTTRLGENSATINVGMANVGIGGSSSAMGVERFQRDVLDLNAAHWLIIFIGVNDIVYGDNRPAPFVIDNYKAMAKKAHEQGLKVYGATITPMGSHASSEKEAVRQAINNWIRTTAINEGIYDGVIDFDAIVRDPNKPTYMLPAYAVDDLHLNITGYKTLADSVELSLFAER